MVKSHRVEHHRLLAGRRPLFLESPLRRQVFLVVIREGSRRQDGSNGPRIIDLSRDQEKDQKAGEPFHLRCHPLVPITTYLIVSIAPPLPSGQRANRRRGRGGALGLATARWPAGMASWRTGQSQPER
jgi:hypothetical protein